MQRIIGHILRRTLASEAKTSDRYILKSPIPSVTIPDVSLPNFIWDHNVTQNGDKVALQDGLTQKKVTFAEASKLSKSFGSSLLKHGLGHRQSVLGILLPNSINYILTLTGAVGAGLTVTTINPAYTPSEIGT